MFRIKEINVVELKKRFDENFYFTLLNVREHQGVEFAKIKDHEHIPTGRQPIRYEEMDKENPIVVMCHTGVRSAKVCQYLESLEYNVRNLKRGGLTHGLFLLIQPGLDINV